MTTILSTINFWETFGGFTIMIIALFVWMLVTAFLLLYEFNWAPLRWICMVLGILWIALGLTLVVKMVDHNVRNCHQLSARDYNLHPGGDPHLKICDP